MIKICLNWLLKFVNELFINLLAFYFHVGVPNFIKQATLVKGVFIKGMLYSIQR